MQCLLRLEQKDCFCRQMLLNFVNAEASIFNNDFVMSERKRFSLLAVPLVKIGSSQGLQKAIRA